MSRKPKGRAEMPESAHTIEIVRTLAASPADVFLAWTTPETMGRWMLRGACVDVRVDLQVGGEYRLEAEMPYGPAVAFGSFREIRAPHRLVFTFSWEGIPIGETLITVDLADREGGTEMRFRQELFPDDQTAGIHDKAWNHDFDQLREILTS